jgi:hypothetical protein
LNILRAFTFIFEDKEWAGKIAVCAIVSLLSFLLTPLVVGAVGWAALLGYQVALVRNLRAGVRPALPTWDDFSGHLTAGINALLAFLIYNLPNIVIGILLAFVFGVSTEAPFTSSIVLVAIGCCLVPFLLVYNVIAYPLFALGMGRYVDDPTTSTFFDFGGLFRLLRLHTDLAIQWMVATFLTALLFAVFLLIPCIGWIAAAAFVTPVFGALVGEFATAVFGKPKTRKPRPAAPRRTR